MILEKAYHSRRRNLSWMSRWLMITVDMHHTKKGETLVLQGAHILIIEDEPLIALDVEAAVRLVGAGLVSTAQTVEQALSMVEAPGLAGAIVDLRLHGQSVREVVKRLTERSIPFVFYTGADDVPTARAWPMAPVVSKPTDPGEAIRLLAQLMSMR